MKRLCLVLAMIVLLGAFYTPAALAESNEVNPRDLISCPYCGSASAYEYCAKDAVIQESDTHSYSGGTCTINEYHCKAGIYCYACGRRYLYGWRHRCYTLHVGCGEAMVTHCYVNGVPMP